MAMDDRDKHFITKRIYLAMEDYIDSDHRQDLTALAYQKVADSRFREFQGLRNAGYLQVAEALLEQHPMTPEDVNEQVASALAAEYGAKPSQKLFEEVRAAIEAQAAIPKNGITTEERGGHGL